MMTDFCHCAAVRDARSPRSRSRRVTASVYHGDGMITDLDLDQRLQDDTMVRPCMMHVILTVLATLMRRDILFSSSIIHVCKNKAERDKTAHHTIPSGL